MVKAQIEAGKDDGLAIPRQPLFGLLGAIAVVDSALRSRPGEGLSRFVDRFDRMGIIRDLGTGANRRRVVHAACKTAFRSPNVTGAEFRKTIVAGKKSAFAPIFSAYKSTCTDKFLLLGIE